MDSAARRAARLADEVRNRLLARTGFADERGIWYILDNAGTIMPAMSDSVATSLFRLEVRLDHEVDRAILDTALTSTASRYRYFDVQLHRGFFWYYLEPCRRPIRSEDDKGDPSQGMDINRSGTRMFRIRVSGDRIAGEFSHALADGSGGVSFMKSLVTEYFRLRGVPAGASLDEGEFADIHAPGSQIFQDEYEDGYRRYFPGKLPHPKPGEVAWHLPCKRLPAGKYRATGAMLPLQAILAESKRRGVSLTELLAAVYMDCLQELWLAQPTPPKHHLISLEIPVNMRKFFPSRTNRNFSLFVLVTQDMRLGRRSFDEILHRAHHQLRMENDSRSISMQIARNVGSASNMSVRLVPLVVKDFFARILFRVYGDNTLSGFISNLGQIRMPPGPAEHVRSWGLIPAPSKSTFTNASMLSWKDNLYLHFGSLARSRDLERLFYTRLRKLGLPVRMEDRGGEE
ncbi:MAG: hypothetical protein ABFC75_08260 [Rectinema sp.]